MERAMPPLTSAQEVLVHLPTEGQFLVRGAAGSGKTTVALARAIHLARQPLLHGRARVLLLARAPALAEELAKKRDAAAPGVAPSLDVDTIARWCGAYLARGDGDAGSADLGLLTAPESAALVDTAVELVRRRSRSQVLRRPLSFFTTELESMLLALGVEKFEDYAPIAREGRGTALDDEARKSVFAVYEEYRALAQRLGKSPPLALVPAALARLASERSPPYDHVLVDDAPRLAPAELKLARSLAAGGSLTLFGALEQKFDPLAASLRELRLAGLDRTEVLPRVLRGPKPIFEAALAVLKRRGAANAGDLKLILPGTIEGPTPKLVLCEHWHSQLDAVVAQVRRVRGESRPLRDVAVITVSEAGLELCASALGRAGIATRRVRDDLAEPATAADRDAVALCPLFAAAGREFKIVIVLDVNRGCFPRTRPALAEHEVATADDDARRALHLAMTRSTEELILIATESARSPLLPM